MQEDVTDAIMMFFIYVHQTPAEETAEVAKFIEWTARYKEMIASSISDPDMDDEIILITCEDMLRETFESLSLESKNTILCFYHEFFDFSSCKRSLEFFLELFHK